MFPKGTPGVEFFTVRSLFTIEHCDDPGELQFRAGQEYEACKYVHKGHTIYHIEDETRFDLYGFEIVDK